MRTVEQVSQMLRFIEGSLSRMSYKSAQPTGDVSLQFHLIMYHHLPIGRHDISRKSSEIRSILSRGSDGRIVS